MPDDDSTQIQQHHSRTRRVSIGLLLGAAAIACLAFILNRDGEANGMVSDRIVVLPFAMLAGVQDSTHLGAWIAHLITLGIVQAEIGDPVLPHEFAAWNGSDAATAGADAIVRAAEVFSAGIVISGTMQRHGDVVDVGAVLHAGPNRMIAIDPVRVVIRNSRLDVDALRQRVVGALAAHLARDVAAHPYIVESPTLASFRAGERANRLFLDRSFVRAAQNFQHAWQLDTTATGFLMIRTAAGCATGRPTGAASRSPITSPANTTMSWT